MLAICGGDRYDATALPIIYGPINSLVIDGGNALFTVNSPNTVSYQWQHDQGIDVFIDIVGSITNTLIFPVALATHDGLKIRCALTNPNGSVNSTEKELRVYDNSLGETSWDFETATIVAGADAVHDNLKVSDIYQATFWYEDGIATDRKAEIVVDPKGTEGNVVRLWILNAIISTGTKGRIQLDVNNIAIPEMFITQKMYLPQSMDEYKNYPSQNLWFAIAEFFMGEPGVDDGFRITVDIAKGTGVGQPLIFFTQGMKKDNGLWKVVWTEFNASYFISFDEWINIEYGYKSGNSINGRFYMTAKASSESEKTVIADVTNWTYSNKAASDSDSRFMRLANPQKLYTSSTIVDHMRDNGSLAEIYFNDLNIQGNWPTG